VVGAVSGRWSVVRGPFSLHQAGSLGGQPVFSRFMPFALAHPAAVLPLRRYCPRQLDFPALLVGSLAPDLGYAFLPLHVYGFSHQFWAGSFGFCLPAGLVLVLIFYKTPGRCSSPAAYSRLLRQVTRITPSGLFLLGS
jgi:hypothetical protein